MGFLDKVKNMFTEEVEEEPIKSEMIQVEIPAPSKMEVKKENEISDNPIVKQEEKTTTPIFFDDAYFKELEQPKVEVKSSYKKEVKLKEEKKIFKPTPIISPVYGVLDKNYSKEDITSKKPNRLDVTNTSISIDDVRKKAFGTLEDELETTLFGNNSILFNDVTEQKVEDEDLLDEFLAEEIVDIGEEPINIVEEEMDKPIKTTAESELFDLIDSMYEKGE